ncbi:S9 family peptidase [Novosphingobium sp. AP12]|uniref:alpha/beta hydrolase family protein n=1 Tax=Novosphingobium sp. AP12 TaxID=1144305 RepID=UPI00027214D0|nr:alpha/beta fold hydrolase [Novosphingobium sp. AP12]EJL30236.1 prolyl oligopeptidase family protein [Novosphingobium sp. AP12]
MLRQALLCGIASFTFWAGSAGAEALDPLAVKFGAREGVRNISISPEGKQIVFVGPRAGGGENAVVVDLSDGKSTPIFSSKGRTEQITHCQFILESRVVCEAYFNAGKNGAIDDATRLFSLASDGSDMKMLSANRPANAYYSSRYGGGVVDYTVPGQPESVLMERWYSPEMTTGTLTARQQSGLGVEAVNVLNGRRKDVLQPRETAQGFISDGQGKVRIIHMQPVTGTGYVRLQSSYFYSDATGKNWSRLSDVNFDAGLTTGFEPVAVDSTRNIAYGFGDYEGRTSLYERTLDGTNTTRLLISRPDAVVDGLLKIGRTQRVIGVSFVTERRFAEYFDPELRKLSIGLGKALGGDRQIGIIDATTDEQRLLVYAGSDTDPGQYYLYDKATKKLAGLLLDRPELQGMAFGQMKPMSFTAADGTVIPGYLTLPPGSTGKNLPTIVMPHGGPNARDEWGFDWLAQYFAAKGYAVFQPNFRGSTGYGAQFFGKNGFRGWRTAIGDVDDAARWLVSQGIARSDKLAIVGWSYGGYAALQAGVVDPGLYKAIVAIAPVVDFDKWREEFRNMSNFTVMDNLIGTGPHTAEGSPARHAEQMTAPVLLFHGDADRNVAVGHSRLMQDRLKAVGKSVDYVEFSGLDHQLDDGDARAAMLTRTDAFLRRNLGL